MTLISMSGFSQSISNYTLGPNPISNPVTIQFKVNYADSISLRLINIQGVAYKVILKKDLFKPGLYKVEYTFADNFVQGVYFALLQSSDTDIPKSLINQGFVSSSNSTDFIKITYIDSVKVFDTTKVTVTDTTKVLIMDTLNCIKTATTLRNYETFPVSESLIFHDNLTINFSSVDNLVLYDLSGKFIRRLIINSNLINLQDLKNGIYVGLFYENGDLIKTIKMIKE